MLKNLRLLFVEDKFLNDNLKQTATRKSISLIFRPARISMIFYSLANYSELRPQKTNR